MEHKGKYVCLSSEDKSPITLSDQEQMVASIQPKFQSVVVDALKKINFKLVAKELLVVSDEVARDKYRDMQVA